MGMNAEISGSRDHQKEMQKYPEKSPLSFEP